MIDKKNILGVGITNATKEEILEYIIKSLENFKKKYFIVTPNPEFLVLANKNLEFKKVLNRAELALNDGIGGQVASKILGKNLKERVTGVELLESLCERVAEKPITVGFLGGSTGVAEETVECLREKYPGLKVAFAAPEWKFSRLPFASGSTHSLNDSSTQSLKNLSALHDKSLQNSKSVARFKSSFREESHPLSSFAGGLPRSLNTKYLIPHTPIDILFVAFGAPKQEFWISENLQNLPVKIAMGVGGAFDYISGKVPRAPKLIQNLGLEWLYRLLRQPWRIKRQLALLEFIFLVTKEKINTLR